MRDSTSIDVSNLGCQGAREQERVVERSSIDAHIVWERSFILDRADKMTCNRGERANLDAMLRDDDERERGMEERRDKANKGRATRDLGKKNNHRKKR